jgi:hypothetical protein
MGVAAIIAKRPLFMSGKLYLPEGCRLIPVATETHRLIHQSGTDYSDLPEGIADRSEFCLFCVVFYLS